MTVEGSEPIAGLTEASKVQVSGVAWGFPRCCRRKTDEANQDVFLNSLLCD